MLAGKRVVVAFSGGVDSTVLLALAKASAIDVLGIHVEMPLNPASDAGRAGALAGMIGAELQVVQRNPVAIEEIQANDKDRCYHCKKWNFSALLEMAGSTGWDLVVEGSNTDDEGDYRPGLRAVAELEIRSPLREAGMAKQEVRDVAKALGLPNWDLPSNACLASRVVYGTSLSLELLAAIDAAEELLKKRLGVPLVRARVHEGHVLRIELDRSHLRKTLEHDAGALLSLVPELKELGFKKVAIDLDGYSTGSLNDLLE